jgi:hypothetical protein
MRQLRQWIGVALGVVVGGSIVGVSAQTGTTRIHACVDNAGNIKIIGASGGCKNNETALDWNVQGVKGDTGPQGDPGPQGVPGPAGSFTGTFVSPNQAYSVTVTDDGIELAGPSGAITLDAAGILVVSTSDITVKSAGRTDINAATAFVLNTSGTGDIESSATMTIKGSIVNIN